MQQAWDMLLAAGADVVLAGHDHHYERFAPQDGKGRLDRARGIRQFVVGTGGAYPGPIVWPKANSEARDANRTGVLRLELGDGVYRWEFLEARYDGLQETGGATPDRGSDRCH